MLVTVVVADAGHVRDVGNGRRPIGFAVLTVTPRHFFGKVHGVAQAAAVAAGVNSASLTLALGNDMRGLSDGLKHGFVFNQGGKRVLRVRQSGLDVINCVHVAASFLYSVCFFMRERFSSIQQTCQKASRCRADQAKLPGVPENSWQERR